MLEQPGSAPPPVRHAQTLRTIAQGPFRFPISIGMMLPRRFADQLRMTLLLDHNPA
jgi:hypothetical protein